MKKPRLKGKWFHLRGEQMELRWRRVSSDWDLSYYPSIYWALKGFEND